jgi:hypothetical protein
MAAEAAEAAQVVAVTKIKDAYSAQFSAIATERKRLSDSVAGEAWEAEMGLQEKLDRARIDELNKEEAMLQSKQDAEIEAALATKDATDGIKDSLVEVQNRLEEQNGVWDTWAQQAVEAAGRVTGALDKVPYGGTTQTTTTGSVPASVQVQPGAASSTRRAPSGDDFPDQPVNMIVDGEVFARTTAKRLLKIANGVSAR